MSRKVKCYGPYCEPYGIKHEKENVRKISGKNYCPECYKVVIKDKEDREELYEYVAELYGFTTPLMKKHIKEMNENNGWSYKLIKSLIKYVIQVKGKKIDMKYGLTLYQNYYVEFVQYVKQRKQNKEKNIGKRNKKRTVKIDSRQYKNNKYKNSKLYDMEEDE